MAHFTYVGILALALVAAGWLQALPGVEVFNRPRRWLAALIPSIAFVLWDVLVTQSGWWSFAPAYTLGPRLFGLPLEEIGFFLVIPTCAILSFEAVRMTLTRGGRR